jgi:serine protease Do
MKTRPSFILAAVLLAVGFIGGITFLATLGSHPNSAETGQTVTVSPQARALLKDFSTAFEAAAADVNPSVVPIFSEQVKTIQNPFGSSDDPFRQFFGDDFFKHFFGNAMPKEQKQTVHALGSGVIVSRDGYILTNNHVVQGADKLTVVMGDKKKYTAKVIGTDPQSDIAVIKIDAKDLPMANLGNSDSVRVGEWVIAIGNPFQLMHTVTAGIISAKGRSSMDLAEYEDYIQTDASINPGNSGGALADLDGRVIGINTAIYSPSGGNVGIGFAIPINMARKLMDQLIAKGKISRGYLGLLPQDIDDDLAKALKLGTTTGSLVGDVTAGGPADKAGIKRGDIITKFNGTVIENSTQLRNLVAQASPGSSVKVTVLRDGKEKEITVVLGERPTTTAGRAPGQEKPEEEASKKMGFTVQNLTADIAKQLGYQKDHGVVITAVTPGSPAEDAGLHQGDLVKQVNKVDVRSVEDFNRVVAKVQNGDVVALLVRRGSNTFYVAITVGE